VVVALLAGAKGIVLTPAAAQDAASTTAAAKQAEVADASAADADDDPYQRFKAVVETIAQESAPDEGPERPGGPAQGGLSPTGRQDSILGRRSVAAPGLVGQAPGRRGSFKIPAGADPTAAPDGSEGVPISPSSYPLLRRLHSLGDAAAAVPSRFSFSTREPFGSARTSVTHWEGRRVSQTFLTSAGNLVPSHRGPSQTLLTSEGSLLPSHRGSSQTLLACEGSMQPNHGGVSQMLMSTEGNLSIPHHRRVSQAGVVEAPSAVPQAAAAAEPPPLLRREDI
jgi:hypothetical protein